MNDNTVYPCTEDPAIIQATIEDIHARFQRGELQPERMTKCGPNLMLQFSNAVLHLEVNSIEDVGTTYDDAQGLALCVRLSGGGVMPSEDEAIELITRMAHGKHEIAYLCDIRDGEPVFGSQEQYDELHNVADAAKRVLFNA